MADESIRQANLEDAITHGYDPENPTRDDGNWIIEGPDEAVGFFGDYVSHDCEANTEGEPAPNPEVYERTSKDGRWVEVTETYTCQFCNSEFSATAKHPIEWFIDTEEGH